MCVCVCVCVCVSSYSLLADTHSTLCVCLLWFSVVGCDWSSTLHVSFCRIIMAHVFCEIKHISYFFTITGAYSFYAQYSTIQTNVYSILYHSLHSSSIAVSLVFWTLFCVVCCRFHRQSSETCNYTALLLNQTSLLRRDSNCTAGLFVSSVDYQLLVPVS